MKKNHTAECRQRTIGALVALVERLDKKFEGATISTDRRAEIHTIEESISDLGRSVALLALAVVRLEAMFPPATVTNRPAVRSLDRLRRKRGTDA